MLAFAEVIAIPIAVLAPTTAAPSTAYHYDGVAGTRVDALRVPGAGAVRLAAPSVDKTVALRLPGESPGDSLPKRRRSIGHKLGKRHLAEAGRV